MQGILEATGIGAGGVGEGGARGLRQGSRDSWPWIAADPRCSERVWHCLFCRFEVSRCRAVSRPKSMIDKLQRASLDDQHPHTPPVAWARRGAERDSEAFDLQRIRTSFGSANSRPAHQRNASSHRVRISPNLGRAARRRQSF